MKRPQHLPVRQTVRIKASRVVMLSPRIIRRLGWNLSDRLHLIVKGGCIGIERVPNEAEWRVSRLRTRTGSAVQRDASTASIRAPDDLLILRRDRRRSDRSKREPGQDDSVSNVAPNSAESFPSREMLQARWQAIREANESLFADLATWLEREHHDLIRELTDVLGEDETLQIAKSIRCDLFLTPGDAWREDVKHRLMAAAFGFCA